MIGAERKLVLKVDYGGKRHAEIGIVLIRIVYRVI
jgi:hypothetical protein